MRSSFSMPLLYHAYVYLEFLILVCTIYILAPEDPDWAAIEARFRNKHSDTTNEDLLKERENK